MTAGEICRTRLLGLAAVTALVAERIYLVMLPQNFNATGIRIARVSEVSTPHARGIGAPWTTRVQLDVLAPTVAEAFAIDAAAYGDGAGSALAGFTGPVGTARVLQLGGDAAREFYDPTETRLVRVLREYFITFTESR